MALLCCGIGHRYGIGTVTHGTVRNARGRYGGCVPLRPMTYAMVPCIPGMKHKAVWEWCMIPGIVYPACLVFLQAVIFNSNTT